MGTIIMPSTNKTMIAAYVKKGATEKQAPMLAKLREIELKRRSIVDGCPFSKNGRQIAEAKFRKYFESQMIQ